MGYNLLINGVYGGYNPLTNHLVISWDIQAPGKLTAKAPENRVSQKETIVFQPSTFRGELLVSGRVPPSKLLTHKMKIKTPTPETRTHETPTPETRVY